jgi:hypothetical protein
MGRRQRVSGFILRLLDATDIADLQRLNSVRNHDGEKTAAPNDAAVFTQMIPLTLEQAIDRIEQAIQNAT